MRVLRRWAGILACVCGVGSGACGGQSTSRDSGAASSTAGSPSRASESTGGETTTDAGAGVGAGAAAGVALVANDGWVDASSNALEIHGHEFVTPDPVSGDGLSTRFEGGGVCLTGATGLVDFGCTIVPPALDCFDVDFGVMVELNLNETNTEAPMAFDPTGITGFAFDLVGPQLPNHLAFGAETDDGQFFCKIIPGQPKTGPGPTEVPTTELRVGCHKSPATTPSLAVVMPRVVSLRWTVESTSTVSIPFDFCIQNLRALTE